MSSSTSYYDSQETMATTAKAKRAREFAKRMLDMIAEFGLLAKASLLPAYVSLFAIVDDFIKTAKTKVTEDLVHASAVVKANMQATPQPAMPAPKSPLMAQSEPPMIKFRNGNTLQVAGIKESMLVISANVNNGPSKPEVKADRIAFKDAKLEHRIKFRPNDMALKPQTDLTRPKELDLAEKAVRDDNGNVVFLSAEERKRRERDGKITFWTPDEPTANVNAAPKHWLLKRRSNSI